MTVPVIHPRFMGLNQAFFPSQVTIEVKTDPAPVDTYGQTLDVWLPVPGLQAISCTKAPLSAQERQALSYTVTDQAWTVLLAGAFPSITTSHRAVIDNTTYDIDAAETDQTGSMTRLRVRSVEV